MNPGALEIVENGTCLYSEDKRAIWVYNDSIYEFLYRDEYSEPHLPMTYDRYSEGHPKFDILLDRYS